MVDLNRKGQNLMAEMEMEGGNSTDYISKVQTLMVGYGIKDTLKYSKEDISYGLSIAGALLNYIAGKEVVPSNFSEIFFDTVAGNAFGKLTLGV